MSRHNRERRRAGVLRAQKPPTPEQVEAHERANVTHQINLDFYKLLRVAQEAANRKQSPHVVSFIEGPHAVVHSYPQHWTPEWQRAHGKG